MSNPDNNSLSQFWKSFGPGLLWAGAAIGVSHLVQSTRAGATTGLGLVVIILMALVLKYPFFEFGPRYAACTGRSLVEGYAAIGRWALWLFLFITLITAIISQAAIVLFTAFLVRFVFGASWSLPLTSAVLIGLCATLLWIGQYRVLDLTIKIILVILALSTLAAAAAVTPRVDISTLAIWPTDGMRAVVPFAFLLALVGWMPSPVDTAVWSSLWTLAKNEASGLRCTVENARLDFVIGYVGTGILAVAFVLLGAGVMYGSGVEFSAQGTVFATQLVDLYSTTLGAWARPVVLAAVVTTMFSTTLTVVDGFPRAIERTVVNLLGHHPEGSTDSAQRLYWTSIIVLAATTIIILQLFIGTLTAMVDFATIVSFLTAPALGYLNLRAVTSDAIPVERRPGRGMLILTWSGLILLGGTGMVYLISLLR